MIKALAQVKKRALYVVAAAATAMMVFGNAVSAAPLSSGSVTLSDPRTDETSSYTITASGFTTATTIRCLEVVLNDQADGGGSIPTGITTTSSTFDTATDVIDDTVWTVQNGSNGTLSASYATGETPSASGDLVWAGVTNGSTDQTYYALLTTYTDVSCTGGNEVDNITMAFAYKDGTLVQLTIEPTLTFVCNAVAASQTVNGATTTVLSSATGIDHGTSVTSSTNGISAHDLDVTTNAPSGYNVYLRHTGQLENQNTDTIANHTGTNGTPTSFPAAGTEAWGYTTDDADLSQFGSNEWAGFTTSNEVVMTNSAATSGTDTTRVGHQVGIATDTPAGVYTTTMIYTLVATY